MKFTVCLGLLSAVSCGAFSPQKMNQRRLLSRSSNLNHGQQQKSPFSCEIFDAKNQRRHSEAFDIVLFAAKIGIFFGSSTGSTEGVADLIASEFGSDAEGPFEIDGIQGSVAKKFSEYDALVVGTPTWNTGADSERSGTGWDEVYYGEMQGTFLHSDFFRKYYCICKASKILKDQIHFHFIPYSSLLSSIQRP